eukprot:6716086-Prymnesium_polylepis.1
MRCDAAGVRSTVLGTQRGMIVERAHRNVEIVTQRLTDGLVQHPACNVHLPTGRADRQSRLRVLACLDSAHPDGRFEWHKLL